VVLELREGGMRMKASAPAAEMSKKRASPNAHVPPRGLVGGGILPQIGVTLLAPGAGEVEKTSIAWACAEASRDVLQPGEEDGALATERVPGTGPPVRGVGKVPGREDHFTVDNDGCNKESRGGLGLAGAREPRAREVQGEVDEVFLGVELPGPAPALEKPGAQARMASVASSASAPDAEEELGARWGVGGGDRWSMARRKRPSEVRDQKSATRPRWVS
jgi:hypothetical protein